jgi:hypothetical protein
MTVLHSLPSTASPEQRLQFLSQLVELSGEWVSYGDLAEATGAFGGNGRGLAAYHAGLLSNPVASRARVARADGTNEMGELTVAAEVAAQWAATYTALGYGTPESSTHGVAYPQTRRLSLTDLRVLLGESTSESEVRTLALRLSRTVDYEVEPRAEAGEPVLQVLAGVRFVLAYVRSLAADLG